MDDKKLAILNDALNAACRVIQEAYGIDDGGYAEMFFEGENKAHFECLFSSYIKFEVDTKEDEEEEDLDHYCGRKQIK
jgi:hypothetical protein